MEIERKFLVDAVPDDVHDHPSSALEQGYVAVDADGTEVRIRRKDGGSTLAVKSSGGLARVEEELPIDDATFERLWPLTQGRRIEKVRHVIRTSDRASSSSSTSTAATSRDSSWPRSSSPARTRRTRSPLRRGSART